MCLKKLAHKILLTLDAERAHNLALRLIKFDGKLGTKKTPVNQPIKLMGLNFPNRIGLAAGLDKNGVAIDGFARMGFGFIEIGTVTPRPQAGNPKPRLFRLAKHAAIINRLGFNNLGVDQLVKNVKKSAYQGILGINIGKNAATPIEQAVDDYLYCLDRVYAHADYITINISSPNTKNLRELQEKEALAALLKTLKERQTSLAAEHRKYVPLLVKLAPDLSEAALQDLANVLLTSKIDGVIATNTTLSRIGVESEPTAVETGGLSGAPLWPLSLKTVTILAGLLNKEIPIIACGGISSRDQVAAMLAAGAELVQVYTAFIYRGDALITELLKDVDLD